MRTMRRAGALIFGLFLALGALAAPAAVVEAVQAPAWVLRNESRLPLAPGMELASRDRLLTGGGARAVIQLGDGSAVKLGENVDISIDAMRRGEAGVFSAAFDVAKGAFRFTTQLFRKLHDRRAISIRAGTVTIGIRGTDLWGRSADDKDLVCLLEGRIAVSHPLGPAVELDQPLQFYVAEKGKAPGPVGAVEPAQLAKWALETELQEGGGTQRAAGRWSLVFGRFDKAGALALHDQLSVAGFAGRIRPLRVSGGGYYEVRLEQLVTEREALALAERLARDLHVPAPDVVRR